VICAAHTWKVLRKAASAILTPQSGECAPIQRAESLQLMYDVLRKPEVTDRFMITPPPVPYSRTHQLSENVVAPAARRQLDHLLLALRQARADVRPSSPPASHWFSYHDRSESRDLATVFELAHTLMQLATPGQLPPLDLLPVLRHVPACWAPWKRIMRDLRARKMAFYGGLLQQCRDRVAGAPGVDAFMDEIIRRQAELELTDDMAMWVAYPVPRLLHTLLLTTNCAQAARRNARRGRRRHDAVGDALVRHHAHRLPGRAAQAARRDRPRRRARARAAPRRL
jgi:hypothetical protein